MNISEKEILSALGASSYKPMTFDELCHYFKVTQKERKLFRRTLKFLLSDRKIIRGDQKRYRLPQKDDFVVGTLKKHSKGFGFLIPDNSTIPDIYLSNSEVNDLMNKDRLKVMVGPNNSGKVVEILQRGTKNIVGKLFVRGKMICVIPQGSESTFGGRECILIPFDKRFVHAHKQTVVCKIKKYRHEHLLAEGEIIKVLGHGGVQEVDFSSMAYKYDLPHEFSLGTLEEATRLKQWNLKDEVTRRIDLRKLPFMTIDGETAKDFDDAVCVQKMKNGHYKLWVSIADVSFFVRKNSHIDQEAYERGTSVYFPGGVIPMLPEVLSNDLCSLRPEEEKMTFTCEMEFDPEGNRLAYTIYESVIISRHRMTYTDIQAILDKDPRVCEKYSSLVSDVFTMNELKDLLKEQKQKRGCLNFDLPESELILDIEGAIETIVKRSRLEAHMLIEEFMIAANEAVAEFMFFKNRPFIYRVHEEPSDVTLAEFNELAHNLGYQLPHQKIPHAKIYSELLKTLKGQPQEKLLNTALLRSMKLARYAQKNLKHFGLASECYTHFTSPIRRYPDLMVHRLLKAQLQKIAKNSDMTIDQRVAGRSNDEIETSLAKDAEHCSKRERTAEEAEREFVALKKAQFMMDKVGQEFVGYVSGVTEFGVFVELEHYFIEGLVHVSSMQDDFYQFIEEHYMLKGRRTKKEYHLGQKVLVEVKNVNIDKRQIDFIFME